MKILVEAVWIVLAEDNINLKILIFALAREGQSVWKLHKYKNHLYKQKFESSG